MSIAKEEEEVQGEPLEQENRIPDGSREAVRLVIERLRPHFIFNSLNQLRYFIREEPDTAYVMAYDRANFLRDRMDMLAGADWSLLREERKRLESYLSLEQHGCSRLYVQYDWEDGMGEYTGRKGALVTAAEELIRTYVRQSAQTQTLIVRGHKLQEEYQVSLLLAETGEHRELFYQVVPGN